MRRSERSQPRLALKSIFPAKNRILTLFFEPYIRVTALKTCSSSGPAPINFQFL